MSLKLKYGSVDYQQNSVQINFKKLLTYAMFRWDLRLPKHSNNVKNTPTVHPFFVTLFYSN